MMNGVTSINVNNQNYQMTFGNKMTKAEWQIVDAMNDALKGQRSKAEQMEIIKRDTLFLVASKLKDSYVGKIMERGKAMIEHIKPKHSINKSENEAYKRYYAYIKQEVEAGRMDADQAGTLLVKATSPESNKLIETVDKAYMQIHLEELKKTNPELYKATLQRYCEERVATMSTWEMIKELAMNMFKKS